jgi:diguanylate cyclase (GGDEF)-like protein
MKENKLKRRSTRGYSIAGGHVRPFALVFAVLALLVSFVTAYYIFENNLRQQREKIHSTGKKLAQELEHELSLYRFAIETLSQSAQNSLEGKVRLAYDPLEKLNKIPTKHGYGLFVKQSEIVKGMGNLTGLGELPLPDSPLAKEIEMALSLSPLFQSVIDLNSELPWVYYISKRDFVYLYPAVSAHDYFYRPTLKKKDFFVNATPIKNPNREAFWTPVYEDEGGKGLMVTLSKPVYWHDVFLGSLSLDMGLNALADVLARHHLPGTLTLLVNEQNEVMAVSQSGERFPDDLSSVNQFKKQMASNEYVETSLDSVGWKVVIETANNVMINKALKQSALYGLLVLLILMCVSLIAWLTNVLRRLHNLTMIDFLTGLHNRRHFSESAKLEFARGRRTNSYLALVLVDIDYFKKYNDYYGHQAGDDALIRVADCLSASFSRATDKVFRIGGEEFAVLVYLDRETQINQVMNVFFEKLTALNIPHKASEFGLLTVSAGAVLVRLKESMSVEAAFQKADAALYRAKENGRNRIEVYVESPQKPLFENAG